MVLFCLNSIPLIKSSFRCCNPYTFMSFMFDHCVLNKFDYLENKLDVNFNQYLDKRLNGNFLTPLGKLIKIIVF